MPDNNNNNGSDYVFSKMAVIYLQNDKIESGCFACEIAKTLHEYANEIEKNNAGIGPYSEQCVEIFDSSGGTSLKCIAGSWLGHKEILPSKGVRRVLDLKHSPKK